VRKFLYYFFILLSIKLIFLGDRLPKEDTLNQRRFTPLYAASINMAVETVNCYLSSNPSYSASLYRANYQMVYRMVSSPKATAGYHQSTNNLLGITWIMPGSQWAHTLIDKLIQRTGELISKYTEPAKQKFALSHGPAPVRESTQLTELTVARQQWVPVLTGCTLLLGIGYIVYKRQQRAIQLLMQQKAEITKQVQHLELIDQKKVNLFSLISHDLRVPVTRLKQQLYTLKLTIPDTAPVCQQIRESEEQVDQLAQMLTNLLDWSVVQMKGLPTNPKPVDLSAITAEVIADVSAQLKHKEIRLINQVGESTWIVADRYRLLCVIRNLVSNAIKFTPPHGYIRLYTKLTEEAYTVLTVQDTGIGMNADQVACVLSAPVIRSGTQGEPGTGLGLLLCRELLGNNPNVLQLISQPEQGTSVIVRLTTADKPVC
jgi:signal transduction histidine kinase